MKDHLQKFFKYAALYMNSSVDSLTAFELARKRIRHRQLGKHLTQLINTLNSGVSVSEACKILHKNKCLDAISWSMISSADKSGSLGMSCSQVSEYLAAASKVKKSLVSSLAYPIGVVFLAFSMVYFLITIIFPKITPLFMSLHAPVPPTTATLMFLSAILKQYSLHLLILIVLFVAGFGYSYKTSEHLRKKVQHVLFKLPVVGKIYFAKESHGLALSCGVLMKGGKSLDESLMIASGHSHNLVLKDCVKHILKESETGRKFSDILSRDKNKLAPLGKMFEGEWIDLITVGEMTGSLPQSFTEISECFEVRLKEDLEQLARWAEPAALGVSASVILTVAMSVIQPMYAILQYVHS
jgi:type IV pilus assembly protein PilC